MNLIKRFIRNDNADLEEENYDDMYVLPEEMGIPGMDGSDAVSSPDYREDNQAVSTEKVSLKLIQPKSHTEAAKIADRLKEGCIVLLDISRLTKDQAHRLVDFLAGVAYVLGGEMIKTNKSTIVVSPAGVDISSFAPDPEEAPAPAPEAVEAPVEAEEYTEEYEEASVEEA